MSTEKRSKPQEESEVWNAIAAFERILEAMPNDRVALETLHEAYEQIGQTSKALEYLLRLGETIVEESDLQAASGIIGQVRKVKETDPAASELYDQLKNLLGDQDLERDGEVKGRSDAKRKSVDIANELALAWNLLQEGQLSQEQYSSVVHDLSETSTKVQNSPVTVLHILHGRGFANLDEVMAFLSRDSGTPVLSLANFEIQPKAYSALPLDVMETRGALVFEMMGRDLLVGVLNPYDTDLRKYVETVADRKCHFYLVSAPDYDRTLSDIRTKLATPVEA